MSFIVSEDGRPHDRAIIEGEFWVLFPKTKGSKSKGLSTREQRF